MLGKQMLRSALFRAKSVLLKTEIISKYVVVLQQTGLKKPKRDKNAFLDSSRITATTHRVVNRLYLPFITNMSKSLKDCIEGIKPPVTVSKMKDLDRSAFDCSVNVLGVYVPVKQLAVVGKCLKKYQLKMMKLKSFVDLEKSDPKVNTHRLVLLDPKEVQSFTSLPEVVRHSLCQHGISENDCKEYALKLSYDNWSFQEILRAVIPDVNDGVSGYSEVGHIAHFNLRDEVLPYKKLIGEVLIDKQPNVKTVVNKLNSIDNTYRNFQMELLAGEDNYIAQTKENGFVFHLDFSKVYWNSRLGTEHDRIVKQISFGDVVFDVFAGIGPFAIPAAKKKATVFANDLNPSSYDSLLKNTKLNKIGDNIKSYNLDGREFIKTIVKNELIKMYQNCEKDSVTDCSHKIHIVMNLPALAVTFLDAFTSLLSSQTITVPETMNLPKVYCYCFTNFEEAKLNWDSDMSKEVQHRVICLVGHLEEKDISVRFVRNVAPNKDMVCISFMLTRQILYGMEDERVPTKTHNSETDEPPQKFVKLQV